MGDEVVNHSYLKHICRRALLPVFWLCVISPQLAAQTLPFHTYTTKDGLPSNHITALCQDSKGFLWIGTDEGLSIYNGEEFKIYTTVDGLVNPFVTSVIESRQSPGTMWIGSIADGLTRYKDGVLTPLRFPQTSVRIFSGSVIEDRQGTIWCMTSMGVFKVVADTLQPFPLHPPEYINGNDAVVTPDGKIWFGVNRRLYIYSPTEQTTHVINLDLQPNMSINYMMVDREGDVWISAKDSTLRRFAGEKLVTTWHSGSHGIVNRLILDRDGDLWMTAGDGILRIPKKDFPAGHVTVYGQTKKMHESYSDPVLEDHEGNIWFGGMLSGLYKLSEKNVVKLQLDNSEEGFADHAGHLWIKSLYGMWECWKGEDGAWSTFDHRLVPDGSAMKLQFIQSDEQGRMWLQYSDSTLRCYDILPRANGPSVLRKSFTLKSGRDFPAMFIWMFYIDPKNFLWLSLSKGIGVVDLNAMPSTFLTLLRQEDEVRVTSVRAIHRDSKGNVWFGSFGDGLSELVGGDLTRRQMKHFTTNDGLPDNGVRSLAEDDRGRLWIGTRFGGVGIFDGTNFQTISIKQGLLSNAVWSITKGDKSLMWLGTGVGTAAVNIANLGEIHWSETMTKEPCRVCYSPITKTTWIVSLKDLTALEGESPVGIAPPVYISRVEVNDRPIEVHGGLDFSYDQNNIIIEFIGLSFRDEKSVRYQYQLQGIDSGWNMPTRQRLVTYAALSPGSYTFEVTALNSDGIRSIVPASFSFTIFPPVWKRWWFIGLFIISLVTVSFGFVRRKVVRLEERRTLQEEFSRRLIESQENERARIAGELHDGLGQNLLVIQNQALLALDARPENSDILGRLQDISTVTTQTIEEVREIARNLRPYHLDKLGLTTSINSIIRRISESSKIVFTSDIDLIDGLFPKEEESHVYRIVQEGLNNIVKHSQATHASVSIKKHQKMVSITIRDNGKGFAKPRTELPAPEETPDGFGLIGLGERVRILNGDLSFGSTPGRGTTLLIDIPHKGEKNV